MPYFKSYHIRQNNLHVKKTEEIPVEKLLEKFNPEEDAVDRRISYEITKKKIDPSEKFSDESDESQLTDSTISDLDKRKKES